ncbi:MAG: septal ring lytic transglycosylase RlpA family protein [Cyanobacteria bacterium J06606_4]
MPPSQDIRPTSVSSAADLPPGFSPSPGETDPIQISFLPSDTTDYASVYTLGTSFKPFPPALMASISGLKPGPNRQFALSEFLMSSQFGRSFNFLGQAWQSVSAGRLIGRSLYKAAYSATVPIQWIQQDQWKSQAIAADIQVRLVNATDTVAQVENGLWASAFSTQCLQDAERSLQSKPLYKISLGERSLGYVADEQQAFRLAQQLKRLIRQASFDPTQLSAYPNRDVALGAADDLMVGTPSQSLFAVNDAMAEDLGYSKEWAAVAWANNLRSALAAEPLKVGDALMSLQNLQPSKISMTGEASWYGPYFHGRATANGETYDQNDLTVAHKSLPFGTQLKVRNLDNGKTVVLRVNDRGPYVGDRILDLSKAAADCLGSDEAGVIPVEAIVLKKADLPALSDNY